MYLDRGPAVLAFLRAAVDDLEAALASDTLEEHARPAIERRLDGLTNYLGPKAHAEAELPAFPLGRTEEERDYRQWCVRRTLFLNPLNDLGPLSAAAVDVLHLPSMRVIDGEGPQYMGFYNQLKQEYAAARYFLYEGLARRRPHYADRGVALVNTLDYPAYSIGLERVKAAYRLCYSIFDKVGYFLNAYLQLGIPEKKVNFGKLWYDKCDPSRGVRPDLLASHNWALQGLFWLSKDLYAKGEDQLAVLDPAARELDIVRNHVEHKYLKLHTERGATARREGDLFYDGLSYSMNREDFEDKALKVLKLARAALIYLAMVVDAAERVASPEETAITLPLVLGAYDDGWKT
jgi:hypothetical protein